MSSDALVLLLLVVAAVAVFLAADRAMKRRARRWESDDWRQPGRGSGGIGNALSEFHGILEPHAKEISQEQRRVRDEDEDEGDPPEPGPRRDQRM